jgi:hypothetical protein
VLTPSLIVIPESTTGLPLVVKTRSTELPLTINFAEPGPCTKRVWLIGTAELRKIVPLTANWIVSPGALAATWSRKEPGPLSLRFVTVNGAAFKETSAEMTRPSKTRSLWFIIFFPLTLQRNLNAGACNERALSLSGSVSFYHSFAILHNSFIYSLNKESCSRSQGIPQSSAEFINH